MPAMRSGCPLTIKRATGSQVEHGREAVADEHLALGRPAAARHDEAWEKKPEGSAPKTIAEGSA